MMMFLLGITATAGAAFVAGRIYENRLQEIREREERRRRKREARQRREREARDVYYMSVVEADAPGEWR